MSAVDFALRCFEKLVCLVVDFEYGFGKITLWCRHSCEDSILMETFEILNEDAKFMLNIQKD